jgi:hypothetical protein
VFLDACKTKEFGVSCNCEEVWDCDKQKVQVIECYLGLSNRNAG